MTRLLSRLTGVWGITILTAGLLLVPAAPAQAAPSPRTSTPQTTAAPPEGYGRVSCNTARKHNWVYTRWWCWYVGW